MSGRPHPPTEGADATVGEAPDDGTGRFPGLRIERRIGAGGSGVVYRAWSEALGASVALKVLRAGRWASDAQRRRFAREVDVHRRLDDPGVVRIFADGTSADGAPWFTMELVEGPSLQHLLDSEPGGDSRTALAEAHPDAGSPVQLPPLGTRVRWIATLARTLGRLHRRGVFHRDVKPSNVLLDGSEPRLADFGVVMTAEEPRLTADSRAVGTPRFMAPEQLAGDVADWARVDIYALGLVLAELCGSRRTGGNASRTIDAPNAPPDLRWIVARATAEAPTDRYATAEAFAEDLERWAEGRPVRWRPTALRWRLARRLRSRVPLLVVAVAIGSLFATVAVGQRWRAFQREQATAAEWRDARERLLAIWADGDEAAAEAWVRRFAEEPSRAGTAALGRAWLDLAQLARDAEDVDAAVEAVGRALAATGDAQVRAQAVEALVADYRRDRRWPALDHLLRADLPVALPEDLRREAAVDVALAAGDVAAALALLPPERAALLAPFREVRALPLGVRGGLDTDGDGAPEWIERTDGVSAPRRDGARWPAPPSTTNLLALRPGLEVVPTAEGTFALGADATAARIGPQLRVAAALGDRVFASAQENPRAFYELAAGGAGPASVPGSPLDSYVTDLRAADLDGDGAPELAASFGPPYGFLVRVYRPAPSSGALTVVAEARAGFVSSLLPLSGPAGPRLLATITHENPSAALFGAADPYNGPCRLLVYRLDGDTLREEQVLPWPAGACLGGGLRRADLDGDGVSEVLMDLPDPAVLVLRQDGEGRLERAFELPGYHLLQVLQADADPADEVLLERRGVPRPERLPWLVGAADPDDPGVRLPTRAWPAREELPDADGVTGLFQRLSLDAQAAELAEQRGRADLAAALWARADRPERAAAARLAAARATDPPDRAALEEAVALALRYPDADLAAEVAAALVATDATAGDAARARLGAALAPSWALDARRTLDPALQVPIPPALRHDLAAGELRITAPSGVGTLLRLPLRATGAPVWLRVAGDWLRAEWGSAVSVELRPVDGADTRAFGLHLRGTGAGGVLFRSAVVEPANALGTVLLDGAESASDGRARVPSADVVTPFDLRIGGVGDPTTIAVFGRSDGRAVWRSAPAGAPASPGEAWELVVRAPRGWYAQPGQVATLLLRRLEVGGFTVPHEAAAALDPAVGWATGTGPRPEGDPAESVALVGLGRLDPTLLERVAAAWSADAAGRLYAATWLTAANMNRADPLTVAAMLAAPPRLPDDPGGLALRVAHAEALLRVGRAEDARVRLAATWEEASRHRAEAWRWRFEAAALLAELALAEGDEPAARAWAARAADAAPDADLGRRLLRHRPRFADLAGLPGWELLGT